MNGKLWGGRFSSKTEEIVDDFNSSIRFDKRLYNEDILGSVVHAKMLAKQNIISKEDSEVIVSALLEILDDIQAGKVEFSIAAEDIHMNIETILINKIGDTAKKLHTARSRNDQVALDLKLNLKKETKEIKILLKDLISVLLDISQQNLKTIMPGFTHLQKAQPVTLAHHLGAYIEMFKRDFKRLENAHDNMNYCPLGACALSGTTHHLDREFVAKELEFSGVTLNSMDSVSDRDYVLEYEFVFSTIMVHLSRFSEEIILWATNEFNFITLSDSYSTGSSIMPQKKNPDVSELIRGKSGRVFGNLIATLTMLKGLPLAYNKDMQEDKEAIFDSIDTIKICLEIFAKMLSCSTFNSASMLKSAKLGYTNATEVADYLVRKGLPFRQTHKISGELVFYCIQKGVSLDEINLDEYKQFSPLFEEDIYDAINLENAVNLRDVIGSPAIHQMEKVISYNQDWLNGLEF